MPVVDLSLYLGSPSKPEADGFVNSGCFAFHLLNTQFFYSFVVASTSA
jgi:hypothetical protein